MSEGDVVMILGGFDEKIRRNEGGSTAFGTIVGFLRDETIDGKKPQKMLMVLLSSGEIWKGPRHLVVLADSQVENTDGKAEERT